MQLFASHQVDLDANFFYGDSMYTTTSIQNGIVICNLDEGDGANQIRLPMEEYSELINSHNS